MSTKPKPKIKPAAFQQALALAEELSQAKWSATEALAQAFTTLESLCPLKVGETHTVTDTKGRSKLMKVKAIKARLDTHQWSVIGSIVRTDGSISVMTSAIYIDFPKEPT